MAKTPRKLKKARARHAKSCEGKQAHKSKREAEDVAKKLRAERGRRNLSAYNCQTCGKWHLGGKR